MAIYYYPCMSAVTEIKKYIFTIWMGCDKENRGRTKGE